MLQSLTLKTLRKLCARRMMNLTTMRMTRCVRRSSSRRRRKLLSGGNGDRPWWLRGLPESVLPSLIPALKLPLGKDGCHSDHRLKQWVFPCSFPGEGGLRNCYFRRAMVTRVDIPNGTSLVSRV
ncbi:hypothetical protein LINGRAHAP2_LOCUS2169 [Linum grandiflorum]